MNKVKVMKFFNIRLVRVVLCRVLSSSMWLLLPTVNLSKKKRRILIRIALITLLVVIPISIYISSHPLGSEAAWFNTNWGYRQRVDIANSGSAQTDFQVSFTLNTDTLYDNGELRSNCNDIRVTDANGNLLPYWIGQMATACGNGQTAQVAWDYNQGKPLGWWKMDECQGGSAYDSLGNNNTGTWNGTTLRTYLDGRRSTITNASVTGNLNTTSNAFSFGRLGNYVCSLNYNGQMDKIKIFNYNLTATQVKTLHSNDALNYGLKQSHHSKNLI